MHSKIICLKNISSFLISGFVALLLSVTSVHAATITVNSLEDDGTDCTLREAIDEVNNPGQANGCGLADGNDTIDFSVTGTITLVGGGLPLVEAPMTIAGPGADILTIDGDDTSERIFRVNDLGSVDVFFEISGLTVTKGAGLEVGDPNTTLTLDSMVFTGNTMGTNPGGAIRNSNRSTLIIKNSTISFNFTTDFGGGISTDNGSTTSIIDSTINNNSAGSSGGGIVNLSASETSITGTTISGNDADDNGGGIRNSDTSSTIDITNSTISGNMAGVDGGGISNSANAGCNVTLKNVTITKNTSGGAGGGISNEDDGGLDDNQIIVSNSIIAENSDVDGAADCNAVNPDGDVESKGNNFVGDIEGCTDSTFGDPGLNDQVGDSMDDGIINPMLAALADNSTATHAPLNNSPVIGTSDNDIGDLPPPQDQRGVDRTQGVGVGDVNDIGAVNHACGDGTIQDPEECDDGKDNGTNGTCSINCIIEGGDGDGDTGGDTGGDSGGDDGGGDCSCYMGAGKPQNLSSQVVLFLAAAGLFFALRRRARRE